MVHSSITAKARRLQVEVAEAISTRFGLTIEAAPPTKPGVRKSGAVYVPEAAQPDLRVRTMGQPGADVVLLSNAAQQLVALPNRPPLYLECKNTEAFSLETIFESGTLPAIAQKAVEQCLKANSQATPIIVLGKNRRAPLVLWSPVEAERTLFAMRLGIMLFGSSWVIEPLEAFLGYLKVCAQLTAEVQHAA